MKETTNPVNVLSCFGDNSPPQQSHLNFLFRSRLFGYIMCKFRFDKVHIMNFHILLYCSLIIVFRRVGEISICSSDFTLKMGWCFSFRNSSAMLFLFLSTSCVSASQRPLMIAACFWCCHRKVCLTLTVRGDVFAAKSSSCCWFSWESGCQWRVHMSLVALLLRSICVFTPDVCLFSIQGGT